MGWVRTAPPGRGILAATGSQGCASLPLGYSHSLPPGAIAARAGFPSLPLGYSHLLPPGAIAARAGFKL